MKILQYQKINSTKLFKKILLNLKRNSMKTNMNLKENVRIEMRDLINLREDTKKKFKKKQRKKLDYKMFQDRK